MYCLSINKWVSHQESPCFSYGESVKEDKFVGGEAKIYDLSNGGVGFEKTDLLSDEIIEYVENKLKDMQ